MGIFRRNRPRQYQVITIFAGWMLLLASCTSKPEPQYSIPIAVVKEVRDYAASHWPDRIMQSVSANPANQVNLSWRTSEKIISGYAEFKEILSINQDEPEIEIVSANLQLVRYQDIYDHYFQVAISGLKPSTEYMVRVGNNQYRSEWFNVQTSAETLQPFKFLYFGDVTNQIRENATQVYRKAFTRYPDARFMVHTGDLVSGDGKDEAWGEWFYAGGWMFQQIPSLAVAGESDHMPHTVQSSNHSLLSPQWSGVFNFPKNNPEGLENLSYYFDYPGVRVIALYTNFESKTDRNKTVLIKPEQEFSEDLFNDQIRWFERVLSSNTQPWLVVAMHHPVFTARKARYNELLQNHFLPLLEKHKVDLVLQGHDQLYARGSHSTATKETIPLPVYVTSSVGKMKNEVDKTHLWLNRSLENTQLYQAIHINQNTLRFESIDLRGRVVDQFRINRSASGVKTLSQ